MQTKKRREIRLKKGECPACTISEGWYEACRLRQKSYGRREGCRLTREQKWPQGKKEKMYWRMVRDENLRIGKLGLQGGRAQK